MMMLERWLLLFLLATSSARAQAPTPKAMPQAASKPADFAQAIELVVQPGLAVQTLLIPLAVHRIARADLSDLGVFDAKGHPVAWAVRSVAPTRELRSEQRTLAFFPLHGSETTEVSGLALHVERSADGTLISVRSAVPTPARAGKLLGYIVHNATRGELSALRFQLTDPAASFVTDAQIEASEDLSSWRPLANEAIGRLAHAGEHVERTRVAIPATRAEFLRVTWAGASPLAISQVSGQQESVHSEARVERVLVGPVPLRGDAYRLDVGGSVALASVTPRLVGDDVLLKATLSVDDGDVGAARQVFSGQLYRLSHEETTVSSPAIQLSYPRARFLNLRVDTRASEPPELPLLFDVAYAPEQLLFVAHGSGPHLLAFGSYRASSAPFSAEQLLAFLSPAQRASLPLASAQAGAQRTFGGQAALTAPTPARSYRTPILWSVLIVASATLLLLALRLMRKTRQGG